MSTLKVTTIQDLSAGQKATLKAGTACVQNPVGAVNSKTTQAHGLGALPTFVMMHIECLTAELGYAVGDQCTVFTADATSNKGAIVSWDTTNLYMITENIYVPNRTTPSGTVSITAAKWKLVATPYILN